MFQKSLIILLILAISWQSGRQAVLGLWYEWNKIRITEEYCENKEDESLQCNGKCHLNKLLTPSENKSPQTPALPYSEERIPFTAILESFISFNPFDLTSTNQKITEYHFNYSFEPTFSFFHPPRG